MSHTAENVKILDHRDLNPPDSALVQPSEDSSNLGSAVQALLQGVTEAAVRDVRATFNAPAADALAKKNALFTPEIEELLHNKAAELSQRTSLELAQAPVLAQTAPETVPAGPELPGGYEYAPVYTDLVISASRNLRSTPEIADNREGSVSSGTLHAIEVTSVNDGAYRWFYVPESKLFVAVERIGTDSVQIKTTSIPVIPEAAATPETPVGELTEMPPQAGTAEPGEPTTTPELPGPGPAHPSAVEIESTPEFPSHLTNIKHPETATDLVDQGFFTYFDQETGHEYQVPICVYTNLDNYPSDRKRFALSDEGWEILGRVWAGQFEKVKSLKNNTLYLPAINYTLDSPASTPGINSYGDFSGGEMLELDLETLKKGICYVLINEPPMKNGRFVDESHFSYGMVFYGLYEGLVSQAYRIEATSDDTYGLVISLYLGEETHHGDQQDVRFLAGLALPAAVMWDAIRTQQSTEIRTMNDNEIRQAVLDQAYSRLGTLNPPTVQFFNDSDLNAREAVITSTPYVNRDGF